MTTYRFEPLAPRAIVRITNAAGDTVENGITDDTGAYSTDLDAGTYLATTDPDRVIGHSTARGVAVPADGDVLTFESGTGSYVPEEAGGGLSLIASTYGIAARYADASPTASTTYYPAWDYLDELGDFLTVDAEDPAENVLLISAPGVYQVATSASTPNVIGEPGEFWLRLDFAEGDPGYARSVARVVYTDTAAYGSVARTVVVAPETTTRIVACVVALTDCEIGNVEVQVTKIL